MPRGCRERLLPHGCSLQHIRLQPPTHTVAGSASAAGGAPSPHGRIRRAAADRARHGARRRL
eukprot:scaffold15753_cov58-Phaeocystis_antarctica.AAC.1